MIISSFRRFGDTGSLSAETEPMQMFFDGEKSGQFYGIWLTKWYFFGKIPSVQSEEAEKYTEPDLQREPLGGEKGRGLPVEYTVEPAPERLLNPVDVLRVRPLTRRRLLERHEAAFARKRRTRGGTANVFALCPDRDGAFYFVRFGAE